MDSILKLMARYMQNVLVLSIVRDDVYVVVLSCLLRVSGVS